MHLHLPRNSQKSIHIRFGLTTFLNITFTAAQIFYAQKAHSVSLLSDALHNLGDVLGLFVTWGAQAIAYTTTHPAKYTYGYQKSTILAAFTNAILLLVSACIIFYETCFKLTHTHAMNEMQVLFIAGIGVVINGLTALLFFKEKNTHINIRAVFLHLMLDALTSLGVVISALVVYYGGYQWIDSVMALFIGAIIWINGWKLFRHSLDLLLDAIPSHIDSKATIQYLKNLPGVLNIQNLHIWSLGDEVTALTVHLVVNSKEDIIELPFIQKELSERFKINQATIQFTYPNVLASVHMD